VNRANGRGNSFQNNGLAGQSPLPIFDAAFGPRGTVPAIAASSGYGSTTFVNNLDTGSAGSLASSLATGQNYVCRMFGNAFSPCLRSGIAPSGQSYDAPGSVYPINFFMLNPYAGNTRVVDDAGWHSYNGLQVQLRKRYSQGLDWTTNYTFSKSLTNNPADNQNSEAQWVTLRDLQLSRRPSPNDRRHVFQTFGTYELPFGKGRKIEFANRALDAVLGGWLASSTLTFSTGGPSQLGGNFSTFNTTAPQGVWLAPGVTLDQISDMFHGQPLEKINQVGNSDGRLNRASATDLSRLAVPLDLIGSDGRADPKYLTWNTTPGQIGQILYIYGKNSFNWNAAMTKRFQLTERWKLEVFASANNVLNHPSWGMGGTDLYSTSFGVTGAPSGNRSMTFRGLLRF
jgi:hypothetical protein